MSTAPTSAPPADGAAVLDDLAWRGLLAQTTDEAALRRPVGGARVMRDQLEALIGIVTKMPHVRLQVLPFAAGAHVAAGGSFTILRFAQRDLPDVVYLEQLTSAMYLDKHEDVDFYFDTVNRLFVEAAPLSDTAGILNRLIDRLDGAPG